MTPETSQIVEEFYAALAAKDLDLVTSLLADDIEIRQNASVPWGSTFHGHSGFHQFVQLLFGSITTVVTMTENVDSDNKTVAIGTSRGRANGSGERFDIRVVHT